MLPNVTNLRTTSKVTTSLPPATYTAASTNGASHLSDGEKDDFIVSLGTWTDGTQTISFEHAPDNAGVAGTWAAITAADLEADDGVLSGATVVVSSNARAGQTFLISYHGGKPWLRAVIADAGGTTGGAATVLIATANRRYVGANNPGKTLTPTQTAD